jgi:hypothetical protein
VPRLWVMDRKGRHSQEIHAGIGTGGLDHPRWLPRKPASSQFGYR